jgi:hypothetical protein
MSAAQSSAQACGMTSRAFYSEEAIIELLRSNETENDQPTFAIHELFVFTQEYSKRYEATHRCVSNYLC